MYAVRSLHSNNNRVVCHTTNHSGEMGTCRRTPVEAGNIICCTHDSRHWLSKTYTIAPPRRCRLRRTKTSLGYPRRLDRLSEAAPTRATPKARESPGRCSDKYMLANQAESSRSCGRPKNAIVSSRGPALQRLGLACCPPDPPRLFSQS
jgi:hypothetical protein